MSTELQRLIISPRDRSNPRLPRQIDAQARKGIDPRTGVAYNLIHPDDYATFRVLSDQEVDRELRYSLDMSKNHVYNWQGSTYYRCFSPIFIDVLLIMFSIFNFIS